jgi:hypothetical protein
MVDPVTIRGRKIHVDIIAELERFPWIRPRWSSDKLQAASPFRYDHSPSFFVRLEPHGEYPAGTWHDSGSSDPEWSSGGLVKLLSFLRQETYGETVDYLLGMYASDSDDEADEPTLDIPKLTAGKEPYKPLAMSLLTPYKFRHVYLGTRMITEAVQREMRVGFAPKANAVVIPWCNPNGTLGNVKYRKVGEKTFWYEKGGRPIREMLYGMDVVYKRKPSRVAICEAEIDALTIMSAGIPAIAVGGSSFNAAKRDLIRRSSIDELIVATDNDAAGRKLADQIMNTLMNSVTLRFAAIPGPYKDVNELAICEGLAKVAEVIGEAKGLRIPWKFGI